MWGYEIWLLVSLMVATQQITAQEGRTRSPCGGVYLLHGLLVDESFMTILARRINEDYPEMDVFISNAYPLLESLLNSLPTQIYGKVRRELLFFCRKHPTGIAAVGHSQGALIIRAYMELFPSYISLAGVQRGQNGIPGFLAVLAPFLQLPISLRLATVINYQAINQNKVSSANYWNDPHHFREYLRKNFFLPRINGENPATFNESFKDGFLKIQRMVTACGPQDAILIPWQSGQFEFFDKKKNIVPYQNSIIYRNDAIGLRTLDQTGRWKRFVFRDVEHFDFIFSEQVYRVAVRPFLGCAAEKGP